jgi:hypothetical protein
MSLLEGRTRVASRLHGAPLTFSIGVEVSA